MTVIDHHPRKNNALPQSWRDLNMQSPQTRTLHCANKMSKALDGYKTGGLFIQSEYKRHQASP